MFLLVILLVVVGLLAIRWVVMYSLIAYDNIGASTSQTKSFLIAYRRKGDPLHTVRVMFTIDPDWFIADENSRYGIKLISVSGVASKASAHWYLHSQFRSRYKDGSERFYINPKLALLLYSINNKELSKELRQW